MRQDFQRPSGQGHQNFPSPHHQKEKCWDLLTPPRRCQEFQVKSQMLQSSLSIATECWILERRLAGGFILSLTLRENILKHRKSILQLFWWEHGIISLRTHQAHLSQRSWTERILHLREHTPLHITSPRLDPPTDTTVKTDSAMDDNVFLARSSDEVYPKHLSLDDRIAFVIADAAEWKAIVDSGSVKVLDSEVANTIRKERPDRVINSRMVRRHKPQEGTFQKPKANSRWCVLGHQDPDAADMFTYAPTPQTESIMMFLFSAAAV